MRSIAIVGGRLLSADQVVLAVGNYRPGGPAPARRRFLKSLHYPRDPWAPGALDRVSLEAPVLLIGTGLTMMDVALELAHRGLSGVQYAISRRGLMPQVHRQLPAMPIIPALWQALDPAEKRRFLRHLQAYEARGLGLPSKVAAGRLRRFQGGSGGARVTLDPRGSYREAHLEVGSVINCTGPQSDLIRLDDPLVRSLLAQGLIRPDTLRLGLDVDPAARVLDNAGRPSDVISYTDPLLRARDWEGTAVPELRVAAAALADRLAGTW